MIYHLLEKLKTDLIHCGFYINYKITQISVFIKLLWTLIKPYQKIQKIFQKINLV
jgi:hypothetical protein